MKLLFTFDNFRLIYVGIATFMWAVSLILSAEYMKHYERKGRYFFFTLLTYAATIGVLVSADFYTLFIFFEIMSLASYVWVAFDERKESLRAAGTYLAVSVIGGLVMLMGIFLLYDVMTRLGVTDAPLSFERLNYLYEATKLAGHESESRKVWAAGLCMLFGFGAKAGAFPLHIWLPKAHPVAPAPASALLSGMLTKTGILGILMLTRYVFAPAGFSDVNWAVLILILGVCTMAIGAVLALFSVDLKKTLACSSVSQIGFIMTGIGVGGMSIYELGTSGAFLHMVGHSLFKLILFLSAGVIYMNLHKLDLNSLRGYGRNKPLLKLIFLSGALGIGGVPLFNGYISKTLIHEGIVLLKEYTEYLIRIGAPVVLSVRATEVIEWIFLISGGCTVAYMLKLFICIFVEKNPDPALQALYDERKPYMNRFTATALAISALIPPILGTTAVYSMNGMVNAVAPALKINTDAEYILHNYFTLECLKGGLISILIGVVLYVGIIRTCMMSEDKTEYLDIWPKWMDLENVVYRPIILYALPFVFAVICRFMDKLVDIILFKLRRTVFKDSKEFEELPEGNRLTFTLGTYASKIDDIRRKLYKLKGRKLGRKKDYVHRFAMEYEGFKESRTLIFRSMSFGLMMFCLGLVVTVAYILITRWW